MDIEHEWNVSSHMAEIADPPIGQPMDIPYELALNILRFVIREHPTAQNKDYHKQFLPLRLVCSTFADAFLEMLTSRQKGRLWLRVMKDYPRLHLQPHRIRILETGYVELNMDWSFVKEFKHCPTKATIEQFAHSLYCHTCEDATFSCKVVVKHKEKNLTCLQCVEMMKTQLDDNGRVTIRVEELPKSIQYILDTFDIHPKSWNGMYCPECEQFLTDISHSCPDTSKCPGCKITFMDDNSQFYAHIKSCARPSQYHKCAMCELAFVTTEKLEKHRRGCRHWTQCHLCHKMVQRTTQGPFTDVYMGTYVNHIEECLRQAVGLINMASPHQQPNA